MKKYRVVIKWVSGEHEFRFIDALNDIHAESMIMDSLTAIQLGLIDTVRASRIPRRGQSNRHSLTWRT